jgi:hypothetical protein
VRNETDAVTASDLGDESESAAAAEGLTDLEVDEAVSPYPDEAVELNNYDDLADTAVPSASVYPDQGEVEVGAPADADVPAAVASRAGDAGGDELFAGDPEEYDLGFGADLAPHEGPVQGDVLVFDDPAPVQAYRPRPMSRAERRRRVRLQARRVRRVIRHVEPWSVLKISLFFYACLWVIFLVAGFMIWGVADSSGTVDRLESLFIDLFSLDEFTIDAGQVFRGYALAGLALAIAGTTFNVLMCLLFNLISDLTGGLRITMIEEETARPAPPRRVRRRRPPVRR